MLTLTPICMCLYISLLLSSYFSSPLESVLKGLSVVSPLLLVTSSNLPTTQWKLLFSRFCWFFHQIQQELFISLVILHFNNVRYTSKFKLLWNTYPWFLLYYTSVFFLTFSSIFISPFFAGTLHSAALRFTFNFYSIFSLKEIQTEYVQQ